MKVFTMRSIMGDNPETRDYYSAWVRNMSDDKYRVHIIKKVDELRKCVQVPSFAKRLRNAWAVLTKSAIAVRW